MTGMLQNVLAGFIVTVATAYVLVRLWRLSRGGSSGHCGTCDACDVVGHDCDQQDDGCGNTASPNSSDLVQPLRTPVK